MLLAASITDFAPQAGLILGVAIIAITLTRLTRRRMAAMRQADATDREQRTASTRQATGLRDQLDGLMVDLEELARATNAQIDTRFAKLDLLLREADEKIARLESLASQLNGTPRSASTVAVEVKPEHRRVHELADAGRRPVDIARELNRPVGEVELILALRPKA